MSERVTFPRDVVLDVFLEMWRLLEIGCGPADRDVSTMLMAGPYEPKKAALCDRLCATGGYRRGKAAMKDLELLYIPRIREEADPADMFGQKRPVNVTERLWELLVRTNVLRMRLKSNGAISAWGPENKHAVHVASGLPLDLFAATEENWHNRLVVTTGPAEFNKRLAVAAWAVNLEWEVYEAGFCPRGKTWETSPRERVTMRSEAQVFETVGWKYLTPEERK